MDNSLPNIVTLRSPYNGEIFKMQFIPGSPPTLETMLQAKYEVVVEGDPEPDKPKSKSKQKETRDGTRETDGRQHPAEGL